MVVDLYRYLHSKNTLMDRERGLGCGGRSIYRGLHSKTTLMDRDRGLGCDGRSISIST